MDSEFEPRYRELSCRLVATDESIIHLHEPFKPVTAAAIPHKLAQIPQHSIGGRPKHADHLEKTLRRNHALVSTYQVGRRKPFGQRQTRMFENRTGHRRNLMTAPGCTRANDDVSAGRTCRDCTLSR